MRERLLFEILGSGHAVEGDAADWKALLAFADRTHLTLHLRGKPGLPAWVEGEIESRRARNLERLERRWEAWGEISAAFPKQGIEFVLLKGFTHSVGFGIDPGARVQSDLDLLLHPRDVAAAQAELRRLGYLPYAGSPPADEHPAPLVRPSKWQWRGDYFDPEMPIPVELHTTAWSPAHDRLSIPGAEKFWERRTVMEVDGTRLPALAEPDRLAFAALHALRHILRNDAKPAHVYELARFLQTRAGDEVFWREWREMQDEELRRVQGIALRFASTWFGGAPRGEIGDGPEEWFRQFAWAPITNLVTPNKDVIWLHMMLLRSWRDKALVMRERLAPIRRPYRGESATGRLKYHAEALARALGSGLLWLWRRRAPSTASTTSAWKRPKV